MSGNAASWRACCRSAVTISATSHTRMTDPRGATRSRSFTSMAARAWPATHMATSTAIKTFTLLTGSFIPYSVWQTLCLPQAHLADKHVCPTSPFSTFVR